jgi:serine/threonine-protein kinase
MSTTTDAIGRVLAGRYRVEALVGTGASANVFAALDVALQRRVAIKVLHPALAAESGFLRRFRAEAQAAAALTHPSIVAVYDWGDDGQAPFLVLQYLSGGSLRDLLDAGHRLSVPQAVAVGRQAAAALAYAHARGVVHRDVKPANLLFDADGRLAVADFGLARALSEAAWTEPAGAILGTARYAAPEQASGTVVDGRSDVYALALVLYETVTGVVPFAGDSTVQTVLGRVGATLPGHDALGPLSETLRLAAAPEPADRLDAGALALRLEELAAELPPPTALPLAGAGPVTGVLTDRTEIGHALFPDARMPERRRGLSDPLALAEAVGVAEGAPRAERRSERRAARRAERRAGAPRRRRWPWVVAVVVVLVAAAAAVATVRLRLLTPSHRLPSVAGLTVARADAVLHRHDDRVRVVRRQPSTTQPAGTIIEQSPAAGRSVKDGSTVAVVLSSGPPPVAVPDLSGVTGGCAAVTAQLAAVHLHATCDQQASTTVPAGQVISWSPTGTAREGATVTVQLSSGPPEVALPSLAGIASCAGVASAMAAAHLVASCSTAYNAAPAGSVVSESPQGQAPEGSTVTVVLSAGPPPVVVPSVIGQPLAQAITALQGAGLAVGQVYGPGGGTVFHTDPAPGQSVAAGTVVTVYTQ